MSTESIWNEFSNHLENFILSKVSDRELAKDLLQDVFVKIHSKRDSLSDDSKLQSWLFQITRNVIIDHYRKKKIFSEKELEKFEHPTEEELELDEFSMHKCLKPYINDLPEKYRDALVKTSFEKISQKDLAEMENISYSAIKSRVQRAREMVKNEIIKCCNPITDVYGNVIDKEPCKNSCGCEDRPV